LASRLTTSPGSEVGGDNVVFDLETFRGADAAAEVRLVVDPVPEEELFVTGQFHWVVRIRHGRLGVLFVLSSGMIVEGQV
jgi:hypothetical protein